MRSAGASCEVVPVRIGRAGALRHISAATDLIEALAARRAAAPVRARVTVFSTVTAALLSRSPDRFAVRFDSPAALNRPGAGGAWQRARERTVLARADALLPLSTVAAEAAPSREGQAVVVLPVPVEAIPHAAERDVAAVAYAGNPDKRGLDLLCRAWARRPDGQLVIGGIEREAALRWLRRRGVPEPGGVEWPGLLPRAEWLALLARARLFVNASRREDFGHSQLEALAAGARLVTVPSGGAYEALALARELDPGLVADAIDASALAEVIERGIVGSRAEADYRERALRLLRPHREAFLMKRMREAVLPALGLCS